MSDFLILGLVVMLVAIFVFFAKDKENSAETKPKQGKSGETLEDPVYQQHKKYAQRNEYAAVTLAYEADACDSVKALSNIRFLVRDAPLLPIRGCTKSKACECQYLHHVDRRKIERRAGKEAVEEMGFNHRHQTRRDADRARHV